MSERVCGNCSACCQRMAVDGLKPAQVRCESQRRYGGCSRYSTRPEGCQTYSCMWLQDPQVRDPISGRMLSLLSRMDRPNDLGVIFDNAANPTFREALESTGLPWVMAREIVPGAFNKKRVVELLEFFSSVGIVVLDYAGGIKGRPALVAPKGAGEAVGKVAKAMEAA